MVVTICEVVLTAILFLLVFFEELSGTEPFSPAGLAAPALLLIAALLHFASIKFFRIEIHPGYLTIRSWQTHFRMISIEIAELDRVKFKSGGPAYSPLLVLSSRGKKLAKVTAFAINADRLENVLRDYEKWSDD